MSQENTAAPLPAGAAESAQQAFQEWQGGNQPAAIERIRGRAESGEPWAIGFLVWLLMQQGVAGWEAAVPYAKQAYIHGMPWAVSTLFNNMIGNIQSAPQLLEPALELLNLGPFIAPGIDPVAQGWNLLAQGQPDAAIRLMNLSWPYPTGPTAWDELVAHAQQQARALDDLLNTARSKSNDVETAAQQSITAIEDARSKLETKAKQAGLLLTNVNAETANALYDKEAKRYGEESKSSWAWGIGTLVAAACAAVVPLVLHYVGIGPDYTGAGLLAGHAGATAALAAVAGVLLARSRGRDRAAQRSRDLSTAMGTMISYSNQIEDDAERQRFMLTMGQLVLQAHLQGDAAPREESLTGLAALLSVMRQPSQPPQQ
jgi:hypothetical protein